MLRRSTSLCRNLQRRIIRPGIAAVVLSLICCAGNRISAAGEGPGNEAERTKHNLHELSLALHTYHDTNNHFPTAVVMGPDGKTPHSWRVELLPYLNLKRLYNQYRIDEPWDSPHNKLILRNMPDVFRSPHDDPKSTNSGYYVFVGPGTVFEPNKEIRIGDVVDGTSNTLMIIEAKQGIPWTKPEDIPFNPKKPAPEFKPFVAGEAPFALVDGSVRWLDLKKHKTQLNSLIIRNTGKPIKLQ
jgi:Protein of unknown function (DUF1559)